MESPIVLKFQVWAFENGRANIGWVRYFSGLLLGQGVIN